MAINRWRRVVGIMGVAGGPLYRATPVLVCLGVLCACTVTDRTLSRPTIASGADWHVEHCAGRRCAWTEDALVANDVRVRIETSAGTRAGMFRVTVDFFTTSDQFAFSPSAVTLTLNGETTLHATGVACARNGSDFGGDGVTAAPTGATHLPHLLCYHLLFDSRPPAVTEEFVVRLNGITRNGTTVRLPEIVFRPHVVTSILGGVSE